MKSRYSQKRNRHRMLLQSLLLGWIAIVVVGCGNQVVPGATTETAISIAETPTVATAPSPTTAATAAPTPNTSALQPALTARKTQVLHESQGQTAQEVPVEAPRPLNKGDRINVNDRGRATVRYSDALKVEIFHDSQLTITGEIDQDASALEIYALEGGTTLNQVELDQIAQKRVRLTTKWAVIEDLGTEFVSYYDPKTEMTWIVVRKGLVEVGGQNAPADAPMVRVDAGEQTWVEPQQQPVQPLPAARELTGGRFPSLEELTDGALTDAEWLPSLDSFAVDQTTLTSGQTVQGTIDLSGAAYEGGVLVTLTNSDPSAVDVPGSVTVPEGTTSQTFTMTAQAVSQPTNVQVIAAYGGVQQEITLTIQPQIVSPSPRPSPSPSPPPSPSPSPSPRPALADFTLNPATINGGNLTLGTVLLNAPAPEGGLEVRLTSSDETIAAAPPSVIIPGGQISQSFEIRTAFVRQDTQVTITATGGSAPPQPRTLTVLARLTLADFRIEPSLVAGGDVTQGQIVLSRAAPRRGVVVALVSSVGQVGVPESVTVAPGETQVFFEIATRPVREQIDATITASLGDQTIERALTLTPRPLPDLVVKITQDQADVSCSGDPVVCYVTVVFTVSNLGAADVTDRFLVLIEADAVESRTLVVDGLPAGYSLDLEAQLGPGGNCYDPDCTIMVTVDPNNIIWEANDQNNIDSQTSIG